MKKACFILAIAFICILASCASAEYDLSAMALEELLALREQIDQEIATRKQIDFIAPDGKTIAELFPDGVFAKKVRDNIGAFSINDIVTQDDLDRVTKIGFDPYNPEVYSLEGIQYLRNLKELDCFGQVGITEIPDEIGTLSSLEYISLYKASIDKLPDSICNLSKLWFLSVSNTNLTELPENIGNLTSLEYLDISKTKITSYPTSIYSLKLTTFKREGLDID